MDKIIKQMKAAPKSVKFTDLAKVCNEYFGDPRNKATSHFVYKTPWLGDPRVNIQKGKGGKAKAYQVKQVLSAIDRIKQEGKNNG